MKGGTVALAFYRNVYFVNGIFQRERGVFLESGASRTEVSLSQYLSGHWHNGWVLILGLRAHRTNGNLNLDQNASGSPTQVADGRD